MRDEILGHFALPGRILGDRSWLQQPHRSNKYLVLLRKVQMGRVGIFVPPVRTNRLYVLVESERFLGVSLRCGGRVMIIIFPSGALAGSFCGLLQ